MKLVCKCGNDKTFYRNISIQAKLKINNKGEDLKVVYDIEKNNIDNYFDSIYCTKCDNVIEEIYESEDGLNE
ncbi:hypothetical protein K144316041_p21520 (plasmid) [Clostridium tetani]|uniref:hypothetical protein n=1 Tax=Clostridium tetani TaxID=1513 RepID=UPI002953652B|nr:hypothetical protein [Clostridium tetani]BDR74313.1 hypothetical protein K144316041_p21520 [Clostridium tetani]